MNNSTILTEEIKRTFANRFLKWGLLLNATLDSSKTNLIKKLDWEIRFVDGSNDVGKYLQFYAINDNMQDSHFRIFENGDVEELEAIAESYDFDETIPGDKEKKHHEYTDRNRAIYIKLRALGLYK